MSFTRDSLDVMSYSYYIHILYTSHVTTRRDASTKNALTKYRRNRGRKQIQSLSFDGRE